MGSKRPIIDAQSSLTAPVIDFTKSLRRRPRGHGLPRCGSRCVADARVAVCCVPCVAAKPTPYQSSFSLCPRPIMAQTERLHPHHRLGSAPCSSGLRVSCGHNQGSSAFLSVSVDVRWVTARAVRPQERPQVQLQFEPLRRSEAEETGSKLVPPERPGASPATVQLRRFRRT